MQLKTRIEQSLKDPLKALAFELWYDHHMTEKEVSEQCIIEGIENIYRIKLMNYIRDFKIEEDYWRKYWQNLFPWYILYELDVHKFKGILCITGNVSPNEITSNRKGGENNPSSKLSNHQRNEIIFLKSKGLSVKEISEKYKVTKTTIYNIIRKKDV